MAFAFFAVMFQKGYLMMDGVLYPTPSSRNGTLPSRVRRKFSYRSAPDASPHPPRTCYRSAGSWSAACHIPDRRVKAPWERTFSVRHPLEVPMRCCLQFSSPERVPLYGSCSYSCRLYYDIARCTGIDRNHPAHKTGAFYRSLSSESNYPHSW